MIRFAGRIALAFCLLLAPRARASTVYGYIETHGSAFQESRIVFTPAVPQVYATNFVSSAPISVRTTNGVFGVTNMLPNVYLMQINNRAADQVTIAVPNDTNSYNFINLITNAGSLYISFPPAPAGGMTNIVVNGVGISVAGSPVTVGGGTLTLTLSSHTHDAGDIISGILAAARLLSSPVGGQIPFVQGSTLGSDATLYWDVTNRVLNVPSIATSALTVNGTNTPPATSSSSGLPGQFAWDSGFLYECIATNTWKRTAISTW